MKKWLIILVVLAIVAGAAGAYYKLRPPAEGPKVTTLPVSRGDIVESVGATGTLEAVTTVQVGSQVSGNIKALYADYNSIVKKGQVIAELDPSLLQTQIEQARANLVKAQADVDRLRVSLDDVQIKLRRSQSLFEKQLLAPQDLETAQVNVRAAEAQLKSSQAAVVQSQASLNQNQVNLQHTVIAAPIDGIVISRNVDVGQTVAASMNAPTLFILAADLTKMQVNANVDESDVGRIRPGQVVRFRVDAYPTEEFTGSVSQVRLQAVTTSNVVTYVTVISVPNTQLKLKPGMTANVTIEIARRADALRAPNAALRFRPTTDIFAALNQPVPPEMQRMMGNGGPTGPGPATAGASAPAPATPAPIVSAPQRTRQAAAPTTTPTPSAAGGEPRGQGGFGGGGPMANLTPEERQKRFQERMQSMTPEEREQFMQRMRERGIDPNNPGAGFGGPGRPGTAPGQGATPPVVAARAAVQPRATAQTIDQLFGALPVANAPGRAWLHVDGQLKMIRMRLGITDGTYTEVLSGEIQAGQELVTAVVTPAQAATSSTTRSPLMPGGPGRPGGGMPGGGGPRH
jgi:HlyD family secretion protein